uniref:tRNA(His) guanylyltransferase n=1 Tax=Triatoma infestans TaxID=30076 RepID=A0A023F9D8_TRIIF
MAKSKFEYVRTFEKEDRCLQNCWIVVRVDGKAFHKFSEIHEFEKPNDVGGLKLMTRSAVNVMCEFRDIVIAFGHSDEYSFVFRKDTSLFNRRGEKLMSLVSSLFSSSYVFYWNEYFKQKKLLYAPSFDARIVLYPTDDNLRDYMSWRQADVHVNNLYNTCFWSLVNKGGLTNSEAEKTLRGTLASQKNEILFQEFNINYNNEPEMFRKGTTLIRKFMKFPNENESRLVICPYYGDIIKNKFWEENIEILLMKSAPAELYKEDIEFYEGKNKISLLK